MPAVKACGRCPAWGQFTVRGRKSAVRERFFVRGQVDAAMEKFAEKLSFLFRPLLSFRAKFPLLSFILTRLLTMLVILFFLGWALFALMALAPGDIVDQMMTQQIMSQVSGTGGADRSNTKGLDEKQTAALRAEMGLDQPFTVQYFKWLKRVVVNHDLGVSLISRAPVSFLIRSRILNSVVLNLISLVFITIFSEPLIRLLYGEQYLAAVSSLSIIVWYTSFSYFGAINNMYMVAENKTFWVQIITLVGAVLNVVLNFFFIPFCGIVGVAIASLITQIFGNYILMFLIKPLRGGFKLLNEGIIVKWVKQ